MLLIKKSIQDVANYFLWFANEHNDLITHLKLQKLCFFAEAFYLAKHGKGIVGAPFQAWKHGPVNVDIWERFKKYSFKPINDEYPRLNPEEEDPFSFQYEKPTFSKQEEFILKEVIRNFWNKTAWDLECLTHKHLPWQSARKNKDPIEHCTEEIDPKHTEIFYKLFLDDVGQFNLL